MTEMEIKSLSDNLVIYLINSIFIETLEYCRNHARCQENKNKTCLFSLDSQVGLKFEST